MRFSAIFKSTSLFSLKDSNSTNSGGKALFLPSPYAVKMAILNQAITSGGLLQKLAENASLEFKYIRDTQIYFSIASDICTNNTFIKIQRNKEDKRSKTDKEKGKLFVPGFISTISFREFVDIPGNIEIIFETDNEEAIKFLKRYIYKINYFGKRGSFFQFLEYSDSPTENNVKLFNGNSLTYGIIQEYDDFPENAIFEKVSNFSTKVIKRSKKLFIIPVKLSKSSKSFSYYSFNPK